MFWKVAETVDEKYLQQCSTWKAKNISIYLRNYLKYPRHQGDQMYGENQPIFKKVAKTVDESFNVEISTAALNLKG